MNDLVVLFSEFFKKYFEVLEFDDIPLGICRFGSTFIDLIIF